MYYQSSLPAIGLQSAPDTKTKVPILLTPRYTPLTKSVLTRSSVSLKAPLYHESHSVTRSFIVIIAERLDMCDYMRQITCSCQFTAIEHGVFTIITFWRQCYIQDTKLPSLVQLKYYLYLHIYALFLIGMTIKGFRLHSPLPNFTFPIVKHNLLKAFNLET